MYRNPDISRTTVALRNRIVDRHRRTGSSYYRYHIRYPGNYYASTVDMLESYLSQGGGGFPDMILTEGFQLSGASKVNPDWGSELYKNGVNCIVISAGAYLSGALPLINGSPNDINGMTVEKTSGSKVSPYISRSYHPST